MSKSIDTAMLLAAGLGTRMQPLTSSQPKPLMILAGRPLIDHVLDRLAVAGIRRAVVNVHYKADMLEAHLAGRQLPHIIISDERQQLLETGGGIRKALPFLGSNPFIVHNSDSIWLETTGSNIARLLAAWDPSQMDCLLMLAATRQALGYDGKGDFSLLSGGHLARRAEAETAPYVFVGVHIVKPELYDGLPADPFSQNRVWDIALARDRAFGVVMEGQWMHVGTPEALAEAEAAMAGSGKTRATIASSASRAAGISVIGTALDAHNDDIAVAGNDGGGDGGGSGGD